MTVTVTVVSLQAPRVLKEVDKPQAKRGEIITYTIKYDNDGTSVVEDFVIIDDIPTNTTYVTDSAEINNQPHTGAAVTVWYFDGSSWQDSNWDNQGNSPQKIRWMFDRELGAQDNSEGTDTTSSCDGDFPDADSGVIKFRVRVE
ncbi:MAG: DUF11 domain-containing protein [Candidatus Roizmanbacteria bacterium]|nr:DUF11 domain-containing protein [Candidatus Roizmanbacteria bacterium]